MRAVSNFRPVCTLGTDAPTSGNALRKRLLSRLPSRLLIIGALAWQALTAQSPGGMFRGEVHDASDAVVPKAKILIRSSEQGPGVLLESNGKGLYNSPTLVPGSYYLTARQD